MDLEINSQLVLVGALGIVFFSALILLVRYFYKKIAIEHKLWAALILINLIFIPTVYFTRYIYVISLSSHVSCELFTVVTCLWTVLATFIAVTVNKFG